MRRLWSGWQWDALTLAGAAALVMGAYQVYVPAGWIVGGLLAGAAGIIGFLKNKRAQG